MRFRGAFGITVIAMLAAAGPAGGSTIETETDGDDFGTPMTAGVCTLREAVEAAQTNEAFGGCPKGSASSGPTAARTRSAPARATT